MRSAGATRVGPGTRGARPSASVFRKASARKSAAARRRANASAERASPRPDDVLEEILETIRTAREANTNPDFFELLGVQVGTDPTAIRSSYRERMRVAHPDVAGSEGHEACVVLNEAYATLMDDELREAYQVERVFGAGVRGMSGLRDAQDLPSDIGAALRRTPYKGEPLSKVVGRDHFASKIETDEQAAKACFVDEITCIG